VIVVPLAGLGSELMSGPDNSDLTWGEPDGGHGHSLRTYSFSSGCIALIEV
jgi:hypothetical protein